MKDPPEWVDWEELRDGDLRSFSWLTIGALLSAANDVLGRGAPRLVNDLRGRWVSHQRRANPNGWDEDLVITSQGQANRFILMGDPGEQDSSQHAVVPALVAQKDIDFMLICGDVIYPAGDVNDYVAGFYKPYARFKPPIFALPGNHDWYDGLNGFMWHFCDSQLGKERYLATSYSPRERIARRLCGGPLRHRSERF